MGKHLKRSIKCTRSVVRLLLCFILAMSLAAPALILPIQPVDAGGGPVGDVIFNYPYNVNGPPASAEDVEWFVTHHKGYDDAYTPDITGTDNHVIPAGGEISFYGYQIAGHLDYAFYEDFFLETYGNSFIMRPKVMNFHSFSETGYLFNGTMDENGGITYYTGYAIILQCGNSAGMQENSATAPNTAALRLYYIDNEPWDTDDFKPGSTTSTRRLISTFKTGVNNHDSTPFRVNVEIDPATCAFDVYIDGDLRASVPNPIMGGAGFGFYTGYYRHDCNILTQISYEQITVNAHMKTATTDPAAATVSFINRTTGEELRTAESEAGLAGRKYRIVQPATLTVGTETYYLVGNSLGKTVKSDIITKYDADENKNATVLYYLSRAEMTEMRKPAKEARVNEGQWETGDEDAPVPVTEGSEIEYNIAAYSPPSGFPVLREGNAGLDNDTVWFGQPPATPTYRKNEINNVEVINLNEQFVTLEEFKDYVVTLGGVWDGSAVLKAWDATQEDGNPSYATNKVFAWITASTPSKFNLYLGGYGGVWAPQDSSYLFNYFRALESANLEHLHTDRVENMSQMFDVCIVLKSLDLSNFDTSSVTDMSSMFRGCSALISLDLSSFNTENVTDMSTMFGGCSQGLTSLDLRNFDTSNVTDMSLMFRLCGVLTALDLSSFNTENVTDMRAMFQYCYSLTALDLTNFDTSNVSDMSYMFSSISPIDKLVSLDVSSFNTSKVTNMHSMFFERSVLTALDLSTFDTTNVTDLGQMFSGCERLTEICLESAKFSNVTTSSDMLNNVPDSASFYVGNEEARAWLAPIAAPRYVIMDNEYPDGIAPVIRDWKDSWIEPVINKPTAGTELPEDFTVTDVVPAGLTIVPGSCTSGGGISCHVSGDKITWTAPVAMLPLNLSFKTTVDTGTSGALFENTASVKYGGSLVFSNTTYHELAADCAYVTEQYYLYNPGAVNTKIDEDLVTLHPKSDSYNVLGNTVSLYGYEYYGYEIGGNGFLEGQPPANITISGDTTIKLYYKASLSNPTVTIYFVDEAGNTLKAPVSELVISGSDWYMKQSYMSSFIIGGNTWVYYDYAKPASNLPKAPAGSVNSPVEKYKAGSETGLEKPVFEKISDDVDITLYFTKQTAVIVHFAEYGNPSNVLKNPETYFVAAIPDTGKIVSTENGKEYTYAGLYSLDGGATTITGAPQAQSGGEVILYFETTYTVTEHFIELVDHAAEQLQPPAVTENISKGATFTGKPEDVNIKGYKYIGYCFGSPNNPLEGGEPDIIVYDDVAIFYLYEPVDVEPGDTYTVTYNENWPGGTGAPVDNGKYEDGGVATVLGAGSMSRDGYTFKGWNTQADGKGITCQQGGKITLNGGNITLYAVWEEDGTVVEPGTYTVVVNGSNATPSGAGEYTEGAAVTVHAGSRGGYTFTGWTVESGGVDLDNANIAAAAFIMPGNNVVVAANWSPVEYTVTYYLDGGVNDPANPDKYTIEDTPVTLKDPVREGYTFLGWTPHNNIPPGSTGDLEFTATWEEVVIDPVCYTVTVNESFASAVGEESGEGSYLEHYHVTVNAGFRGGYDFDGWIVDSGNVVLDDPSEATASFVMIAEEVTVTAQWRVKDAPEPPPVTPDAHAVTVNESYARVSGEGVYYEGDIVAIDAGSRSGYRFNGWTIDSGGVTLANVNRAATTFVMPANSVTVTVNWRRANDGSGGGDGGGGSDVPDTNTNTTTPTPPATTTEEPETVEPPETTEPPGEQEDRERTDPPDQTAQVNYPNLPPPPPPTVAGNNMVLTDIGTYLEIEIDGSPLGEWRWDEETLEWIFEDYTPLGALPKTGGAATAGGIKGLIIIIGIAAVCLWLCLLSYKKERAGGR